MLDGPLRKGQHITDAVGLVKTHHVRYLPDALNRVVGALDAGERTPVFRIDARPFSRHAWVLRLPGPPGGPWRASSDASERHAAGRGNHHAGQHRERRAPRFASVPHKDPRAPQNLAPIRALERLLRHRLGDAQVWYRALRVASSARLVSPA